MRVFLILLYSSVYTLRTLQISKNLGLAGDLWSAIKSQIGIILCIYSYIIILFLD
jgi:hypothetical protein